MEVLGPIETTIGDVTGLPFLREPKRRGPMPQLDFEPGGKSACHTINGHSIVLRLRFGNFRTLFAGDLNSAAEERLAAERKQSMREPDPALQAARSPPRPAAARQLVSIASYGRREARRTRPRPAARSSARGPIARSARAGIRAERSSGPVDATGRRARVDLDVPRGRRRVERPD